MKNKMMRLLSLMLALVLAVGLVQVSAVEAEAASDLTFNYAYDCQRDPAYPKVMNNASVRSLKVPFDGSRDPFSESEGDWMLDYNCKYSAYENPSENMKSVADRIKSEYGMNSTDNLEVFTLYNGTTKVVDGFIYAQTASFTFFVGTQDPDDGIGYLLSVSDLTNSSYSEDVTKDATTGDFHQNTELPDEHTHEWKAETIGNGTKEAMTSIHCVADGCDMADACYDVKLTASDVTLPGDVFAVTCTVSEGTLRTSKFPTFSVSQTPGYKYSADGSDYADIDPATFQAKQGYYQASIVILDGNTQLENLFVKYTVSDPVVTAATGDERPIELMLVGMVTFGAMAALAFIMDGKRRMGR